ncbi:MAG: 4-hydroxy-tetrahydrodipicolinate reductase [Chloroflexota bacterium]
MTRIAIAGIGGRMGREVAAAARANDLVQLVGGIARPERVADLQREMVPEVRITGRVEDLLPDIDVLIDFTSPEATTAHALACAEAGRAMVSGVTGLSAGQLAELQRAAQTIPLFYARNMSLGVNSLIAIMPMLARALAGYDIEIVEQHHRHKADAPSGTALAIAEAIGAALGRDLATHASFGRRGLALRQPGEIGIHAVRGGGNAGEHTVILADEGEEIRIVHRAYSRRTFALGALRAAVWLAHQPPGFYGMTDLLETRQLS